MKRIIDIAIKDLTQSFRSLFAIMFMFVVPILMTAMFYVMFGGAAGEDEGFVLPITRVIVINQDQGQFGADFSDYLPQGSSQGFGSANIPNLGGILTAMLQSDNLKEILDVTVQDNAATARAAVDNQEAGVAVIIPEELTDIFIAPEGQTAIEVYQDPTLSVGPAIVKGIINQFLDNFSAAKITLGLAITQLAESGSPVDETQIQGLIAQYLEVMQPGAGANQAQGVNPSLAIRSPQSKSQSSDSGFSIIAMMMTGMSVFYIFFTGASAAQSILREEEKGTLQRLFTTPNPASTILSGKFLAVGLTISVQIAVLLGFGFLVFKINWGDLLALILISTAITLAASAFGIFLISWTRTQRQAGFVVGALVTIMGMAGMMPIFTAGMPNPPAFIKTASLSVPQGWAVNGLQTIMLGGRLAEISNDLLVLLAWTMVFFVVGIVRFRSRYADV